MIVTIAFDQLHHGLTSAVNWGCFQESARAAVGGGLKRVVGGAEDAVDADDVDGVL